MNTWCIYYYNTNKDMYANFISFCFILSVAGTGFWFLIQV